MTPLDYYQAQCCKGAIVTDPEQLVVMKQLQKIYFELLREQQKRTGLLASFRPPQLVKGLYIWGGVGIGKTFMMDCFYQCIPFPQKMRMHFHHFMQWIHQELKKYQGRKNPLQIIAKNLAAKILLLCFDELFVADITDAMLLGRLLSALFSQGVCLIATSNTMPDDLYKNGLQREQFLPAIDKLKTQTQVVHVPTRADYRLRQLQAAGVFYTPLGEAANVQMEKSFALLAQDQPVITAPVKILGRDIPIKKRTENIIWFDFANLCHVPRSQNDYLIIAEQYRTVFISDIPIIPSSAKDTICLFVSLVDVLYDARVRLIISAAEPIAQLYNKGYMTLEYTRTHSRLLEMQSKDYFLACDL